MKTGWYSDKSEDPETKNDDYPWQPYLQLDGWYLDFEVWFRTEEDCDRFIREHVIGQQMFDKGK